MAKLASSKENEVELLADQVSERLEDRIYEVLACFRDRPGVATFSLVLCRPPLDLTDEEKND